MKHKEFYQQRQKGYLKKKLSVLEESYEGIAAHAGYYVRNILGDGNCFFRAVADQLPEYEHNILREMAVNHIRSNPDFYRVSFTDESMEQYTDRMERDGEYVDGTIIQALSNALRLKIEISGVNLQTVIDPIDEFSYEVSLFFVDGEGEMGEEELVEGHYLSVIGRVETKQEEQIFYRGSIRKERHYLEVNEAPEGQQQKQNRSSNTKQIEPFDPQAEKEKDDILVAMYKSIDESYESHNLVIVGYSSYCCNIL